MTGISNGRMGMMLLVGTETVLFSSFIGAYLVLRMAAAHWPPLGTPHLTMGLALLNTAILVVSSCVIAFANRRHTGESRPQQGTVPAFELEGKGRYPELSSHWTPASAGVTACFFLGVLFLCLQVAEFHRLYARGLTLQTGTYGALFYTLITCHGLHVLGGLGILAAALWMGRGASRRPLHIQLDWIGYAEMYWHFVTAVWLVLFAILYII